VHLRQRYKLSARGRHPAKRSGLSLRQPLSHVVVISLSHQSPPRRQVRAIYGA
jgi:hypothetical protein